MNNNIKKAIMMKFSNIYLFCFGQLKFKIAKSDMEKAILWNVNKKFYLKNMASIIRGAFRGIPSISSLI